MAAASTPVTEAHFKYIADHTTQEDAFLGALKTAALAAGIPDIWISPEQASFMQILLGLAGATHVVEVGTLAGYSAISMARALPPGGAVRTIEVNDVFAGFAEAWVARSDVSTRVEVIRGRGLDVLPRFPPHSADAAFVDADKDNYPGYLAECLRIVRPGGLVMVDNALAFGQLLDEEPTDPDVPAVRAFNELIARTAALRSILVPIGDGLWVGIKARPAREAGTSHAD
jgi:predicted O-methyltransferase YrrM